jgi:DinB superfamily
MSEACEICGFSYDVTSARHAGSAITDGAAQLATIVEPGSADLMRRPAPATWSVLEYCCHVRDVLLVQRERVLLARRTLRPAVATMGRDDRVEHDGYAQQHPADVARQLRDAASLFAGVLARFDDETWDRTLLYNYPERTERDLAWVAVHTQHEVHHHLADVRAQIVDSAG